MPNDDNPKLDAYLKAEIQAQTPSERLRTKLGYNNYDDPKFNEAYRVAKLKNRSVVLCEWCKLPMVLANTKLELKLCPKCEGGRTLISNRLARLKKQHLSQEDAQALINSKTTRQGPFNYKK